MSVLSRGLLPFLTVATVVTSSALAAGPASAAGAAQHPTARVVVTSRPHTVRSTGTVAHPRDAVTVRGKAAPRGGRVLLQRRAAGTWRVVATAAVSRTGGFAVTGRQLPVGTALLRVAVAGPHGTVLTKSTSFAVAVASPQPPGLPTAPVRPAPAPSPAPPAAVPATPPAAPPAAVPTPAPASTPPAVPAGQDAPVVPSCTDPARPTSGLFVAGFLAGSGDGYVGRPFGAQLEAAGGTEPYTWSVHGALPAGISLVGDRLTGVPEVKGVFSPAVTVTDATGHSATTPVCVQFVAPLHVPPTTVTVAAGHAFSAHLTVTGGYAPVVVEDGDDAGDVGLFPSGDGLMGTISTPGTYSFELTALDGGFGSAGGSLTVVVGAPTASPRTLHVPADYATIGAAMTASRDGDTIVVGPGNYHEAVDFHGRAVTLESSDGPATTVIDASGLGATAVTFHDHEGPASVLRGFTVQHGDGSCVCGYANAGGITIFQASPTVTGNIVRDNVSTYGGAGIAVGSSAAVVTDNVIEDNGMVPGYTGGEGGGLFVGGVGAVVTGNLIQDNSWNGSPAGAYVAGIDVLFADNIIRHNAPVSVPVDHPVEPTATSGLEAGGDVRVIDNVIDGNGGDRAVQLDGSDDWMHSGGSVLFAGNTVTGNTRLALVMQGFVNTLQLVDNVIDGGAGAAIACNLVVNGGRPSFSHDDVVGPDISTDANDRLVPHACGFTPGRNGNLALPPLFSASSPYVPAQGSPLVDAGERPASLLGTTDVAGDPRLVDGDGDGVARVDIGAYERP